MIGGDDDDEPVATRPLLERLNDPAELTILFGQSRLHFGRFGTVCMADEIDRLEIHEHQIGDVIDADRFVFDHGNQSVSFEFRVQSRAADGVGIRNVVTHPMTARGLPERLRLLVFQIVGNLVTLGIRVPGSLARVGCKNRRARIEQACAVAGQTRSRGETAPLDDDHRLSSGLQIPQISQREHH